MILNENIQKTGDKFDACENIRSIKEIISDIHKTFEVKDTDQLKNQFLELKNCIIKSDEKFDCNIIFESNLPYSFRFFLSDIDSFCDLSMLSLDIIIELIIRGELPFVDSIVKQENFIDFLLNIFSASYLNSNIFYKVTICLNLIVKYKPEKSGEIFDGIGVDLVENYLLKNECIDIDCYKLFCQLLCSLFQALELTHCCEYYYSDHSQDEFELIECENRVKTIEEYYKIFRQISMNDERIDLQIEGIKCMTSLFHQNPDFWYPLFTNDGEFYGKMFTFADVSDQRAEYVLDLFIRVYKMKRDVKNVNFEKLFHNLKSDKNDATLKTCKLLDLIFSGRDDNRIAGLIDKITSDSADTDLFQILKHVISNGTYIHIRFAVNILSKVDNIITDVKRRKLFEKGIKDILFSLLESSMEKGKILTMLCNYVKSFNQCNTNFFVNSLNQSDRALIEQLIECNDECVSINAENFYYLVNECVNNGTQNYHPFIKEDKFRKFSTLY